jgi:hypothetical protein
MIREEKPGFSKNPVSDRPSPQMIEKIPLVLASFNRVFGGWGE